MDTARSSLISKREIVQDETVACQRQPEEDLYDGDVELLICSLALPMPSRLMTMPLMPHDSNDEAFMYHGDDEHGVTKLKYVYV